MRMKKIITLLAFVLVGWLTSFAQTEGYTLDIKTVDGTSASIPVDKIRNAAIIEAPHCQLNVSASDGGYALGGRKVYKDQTVTITAIAKPGNRFLHWADKDASGNYITENPRTITIADVTANIDYNAVFEENTEYFYFEAMQQGTTVEFVMKNTSITNLQYSTDKIEWTSVASGTNSVTLAAVGDKVYWRSPEGNERFQPGTTRVDVDYFNVKAGEAHIGGNMLTLLEKSGKPASISTLAFYGLFKGCKNLTAFNADFKLPITEVPESALNYTFQNCTDLVDASALTIDVENVGYYGCQSMFSGCTSLVKAPRLVKTTSMESKCQFQYMFKGCTSLTDAPELPSTSLKTFCYDEMFSGCTSMTHAPELPAETLASNCYNGMFLNCTSLSQAPRLPAETLVLQCYQEMFSGCTSLTQTPELPATTIAQNCYTKMFQGCTSLTAASALRATETAGYCYQYMFDGCTALEVAPEIYITKVAGTSSLQNMFSGCLNLRSVKVHFEAWPSSTSTTKNWFLNAGIEAASTPTFYQPVGTNVPSRSVNTIPSGWNIVNF